MADLHFTFGDPEPVVNGLQDVLAAFYSDTLNYYEPPISRVGLASLAKSNATHGRCLNFKVQQMSLVYKQGPLSARDFRRSARDLITFGDCHSQNIFNGFNKIVRQVHIPTIYMRHGKKDRFFQLRANHANPLEFEPGEVMAAIQYDCAQSIYGIPDWIGAFNDVFLNSEATLFRRRYYKNGSQLGFILYTNDANLKDEDETAIAQKIEDGKGVGNFRSMFINIPGGGEKAVQLIPVGESGSKDEFQKIKDTSKLDILVGHGMQASLAGVIPENTGGFGDIEKIQKFYRENEVAALVQPFEELNDFLPPRLQYRFDFDV